jgi:hypothetical protein
MNKEEIVLGKITSVEFGQYSDRSFLFGLQLCFQMECGQVCDGGRYTVNISPECKWDSHQQRLEAFMTNLEELNRVLKAAKVNYVSQLKNKPVEITLVDRTFKSFRILTEVL